MYIVERQEHPIYFVLYWLQCQIFLLLHGSSPHILRKLHFPQVGQCSLSLSRET